MNRRYLLQFASCALAGSAVPAAWSHVLAPLYEEVTQLAHPQIIADCSNNPLDIRPLVQAIMTTSNFILERLPSGTPLVIIMSEAHNRPSHILARMALLDALKHQSKDTPEKTFAYGTEYQIPKPLRELAQHHYASTGEPFPANEGALYSWLITTGLLRSNDAPVTTRLAHDFLMRQGITFSPNDIAQKYDSDRDDWIIDQTDPEARKIIEQHASSSVGKKIPRISRLGVALSNHMIVKKARDHISTQRPKIYVQHCGLSHALGIRQTKHVFRREQPYETSLTALFQRHGFAVLTICPADINTPHQSKTAMEQTIFAAGLDQSQTQHLDSEEAHLKRLEKHSQFAIS